MQPPMTATTLPLCCRAEVGSKVARQSPCTGFDSFTIDGASESCPRSSLAPTHLLSAPSKPLHHHHSRSLQLHPLLPLSTVDLLFLSRRYPGDTSARSDLGRIIHHLCFPFSTSQKAFDRLAHPNLLHAWLQARDTVRCSSACSSRCSASSHAAPLLQHVM